MLRDDPRPGRLGGQVEDAPGAEDVRLEQRHRVVVQREVRGTVPDHRARVGEGAALAVGQAEAGQGEVGGHVPQAPARRRGARQTVEPVESRLDPRPQTPFPAPAEDGDGPVVAVFGEQVAQDAAAEETGRAGEEYGHGGLQTSKGG
ncbi:hypothetical protein GCM10017744_021160 [Streptomyces antimycoticus]